METETQTAVPAAEAARQHVRGSGVMLIGRVFSLVLNFLSQILVVRLLAKSDYGAYAYALTVSNIGSMTVLLCMDKALARFLPIYHERGDYGRLWGAVLVGVATVLSLGTLLIGGFHLLPSLSTGRLVHDPLAASLLLILIALAPVEGLESLCSNLFAVFARPREIFFPRYLLHPALGIGVVAAYVLFRGQFTEKDGVLFLAAGTLTVGIIGAAVHVGLLGRVLRERGVLQRFRWREIRFPVRELFRFALPLLASDLVFILRGYLVVVLLERFHTTTDVALFNAVMPVAKLNQVVSQSFMVLFMPNAARLHARDDREGVKELYWNSALWIAVVSFPLLAVSFSLAEPLTLLLYGERYAGSAIVLALLAVGYYFNAALGFNGLTLQAYGKVRYILIVDIIGAVVSLAANLVLIWKYGAIGAAIGTSGTMILQNLLYQAGLRLAGMRPIEPRYLRPYGLIALAAVGLLAAQKLTGAPIWLGLPVAAIVSLGMIVLNRRYLRIEETFPELLRLPLARRLFAVDAL